MQRKKTTNKETSINIKQHQHGVTLNLAMTFCLERLAVYIVTLDQPVCEIVFDYRETQKTIPGQTLQTDNR